MHPFMRALGALACSLFILCGAGCVSTPDALSPPIGANTDPGEGPLEAQAAERELEVVQRMIQAGEYSLAIPRLMHIRSKYTTSPAATDALYYLGIAYFKISGYTDSQGFFKEYLAAAPEGSHAVSSRQYLDTLENDIGERLLTQEELARRIDEVEAAAAGRPLELPQRLELADLHWKKGEYVTAGRIYEDVLAEYPQIANDMTIRTRIEKVSEDTYVLLTPEEVVRRDEETNPLAIFNTSAFRSGRFQGVPATSQERYYTVTGQVANRGSEDLLDVEVFVTIYGFGSLVYDTQTIKIGALRPGEIRAFSARFNNFDDIENVNRYECIGTFRRQG